MPASSLSKSAFFNLEKIKRAIAAALSDLPGAYPGANGSIVFEVQKDGTPQFSDSPGNNDKFKRKMRQVIAKAGPFPICDEGDGSNRIQVKVQTDKYDYCKELSVNMLTTGSKVAAQ